MLIVICCNFYNNINKRWFIYIILPSHIIPNIYYEKLLNKNLKLMELHYSKD